ncbi:hypothetical protein TTHERM_01311260 (macronuclear) [Tetrahymena thermophila SB210]|uniref:Transmembrane protein n=1 Tax=Tetrahymena thermophila (strain SB210) TaxID=312017 RepID=Q24F81_TETTS|nr:hypothetical protein TTHERM_01311260 [Tetrahymena thermophila SB210]EAS06443.1 hypothetical protein TTHERM_01311260 [Tetrahymena thermophila SB210]|eukprot:XP_001026688.1 hypothetical protein TTHERM_01311260 [Tetrahymena thermophila SB210]
MHKNIISLLFTFALLFSHAQSSKQFRAMRQEALQNAESQTYDESKQFIQVQNGDLIKKNDGTLNKKATELIQSGVKATASSFFDAGQANCFNQCQQTYKGQVYWYPEYSKYFCCATYVHIPIPGNLGWYKQSCAPVYLNC